MCVCVCVCVYMYIYLFYFFKPLNIYLSNFMRVNSLLAYMYVCMYVYDTTCMPGDEVRMDNLIP